MIERLKAVSDLTLKTLVAKLAERGIATWPVSVWRLVRSAGNGQSLTAYVTQFLVPTLSPDDVVIMDNLGSHKGTAVRNPIRAAWARLLFLPPYSPDLNAHLSEVEGPVEQMFAKLKLLLRKAAERTVEATSQRIGSLLNAFPPHECANYLTNSGYAST